jgi:hypothetical protein
MDKYEPRPESPVDAPLDVRIVDNEIVVIGPGAIAMTMSAARATSRRLSRALSADPDDSPER